MSRNKAKDIASEISRRTVQGGEDLGRVLRDMASQPVSPLTGEPVTLVEKYAQIETESRPHGQGISVSADDLEEYGDTPRRRFARARHSEAVERIEANINKRAGIGWAGVDDETGEEIRAALRAILCDVYGEGE